MSDSDISFAFRHETGGLVPFLHFSYQNYPVYWFLAQSDQCLQNNCCNWQPPVLTAWFAENGPIDLKIGTWGNFDTRNTKIAIISTIASISNRSWNDAQRYRNKRLHSRVFSYIFILHTRAFLIYMTKQAKVYKKNHSFFVSLFWEGTIAVKYRIPNTDNLKVLDCFVIYFYYC